MLCHITVLVWMAHYRFFLVLRLRCSGYAPVKSMFLTRPFSKADLPAPLKLTLQQAFLNGENDIWNKSCVFASTDIHLHIFDHKPSSTAAGPLYCQLSQVPLRQELPYCSGKIERISLHFSILFDNEKRTR